MNRFDTIADLTNPELLGKLTGPIVKINTEPFAAIGFSGSSLQRVRVLLETGATQNFILKQTQLKADWLSQRSNDRVGREAALLDEDCLAKIWSRIHCPYVAFARENGSTGLLMDDLSDYLFPDAREAVDVNHEDIILDAIASVHALFWDSSEIKKLEWLAGPHDYLSMLGPGKHEADKYCPPPDKIKSSMLEGWKIALELLPGSVKNYLTKPVEEIFETWKDLSATLLHGDLKIANMGIVPKGKLVLFDWPMIGCAPCGIELGWYLAVNSTRLARTKEEFISKYRFCLEYHLQFSIDEKTWQRITQLAIITGGLMMLWSKALGLKSGTQRGKDEWEWWRDQLKVAIS